MQIIYTAEQMAERKRNEVVEWCTPKNNNNYTVHALLCTVFVENNEI